MAVCFFFNEHFQGSFCYNKTQEVMFFIALDGLEQFNNV